MQPASRRSFSPVVISESPPPHLSPAPSSAVSSIRSLTAEQLSVCRKIIMEETEGDSLKYTEDWLSQLKEQRNKIQSDFNTNQAKSKLKISSEESEIQLLRQKKADEERRFQAERNKLEELKKPIGEEVAKLGSERKNSKQIKLLKGKIHDITLQQNDLAYASKVILTRIDIKISKHEQLIKIEKKNIYELESEAKQDLELCNLEEAETAKARLITKIQSLRAVLVLLDNPPAAAAAAARPASASASGSSSAVLTIVEIQVGEQFFQQKIREFVQLISVEKNSFNQLKNQLDVAVQSMDFDAFDISEENKKKVHKARTHLQSRLEKIESMQEESSEFSKDFHTNSMEMRKHLAAWYRSGETEEWLNQYKAISDAISNATLKRQQKLKEISSLKDNYETQKGNFTQKLSKFAASYLEAYKKTRENNISILSGKVTALKSSLEVIANAKKPTSPAPKPKTASSRKPSLIKLSEETAKAGLEILGTPDGEVSGLILHRKRSNTKVYGDHSKIPEEDSQKGKKRLKADKSNHSQVLAKVATQGALGAVPAE